MKESCPICNSTQTKIGGTYRNLHTVFSGLKRFHCDFCGMGFASPMPAEASLIDYNSNYFSSAHKGYPTSKKTLAFFSGLARLRMAYIDSYLDLHQIKVSKLFELGPGLGIFAHNWLEKYPKTKYIASETDFTCHPYLYKLGINIFDRNVVMKPPEADLIVMSHVLEHVANPIQFLGDATRGLRKGGVLFIEVPCRDYEHKSIDEPHLLFFDKKPMQRLLEELGYNHIRLSYHGVALNCLCSSSFIYTKWMAFRSKLIACGIVSPFSRRRPGMEFLHDPIQRAMIAPSKAYIESVSPAWWLRAIAIR